jgi:hypothetical protein
VPAVTVLTSEPLKAKVYKGEEAVGQTPYPVHGKRGEVVTLKLVKRGFRVKSVSVEVGMAENVHIELERDADPPATARVPAGGRVPGSPLDRIGVPSKENDKASPPPKEADIPRL